MKGSMIGQKNKWKRKMTRKPSRTKMTDEIQDIARALVEYGRHRYNSICRFNHHVDVTERGRIYVDGENYGSEPEFIRAAKFLYNSGYSIRYMKGHPTLIDPDGELVGLTINDVERMMR